MIEAKKPDPALGVFCTSCKSAHGGGVELAIGDEMSSMYLALCDGCIDQLSEVLVAQ